MPERSAPPARPERGEHVEAPARAQRRTEGRNVRRRGQPSEHLVERGRRRARQRGRRGSPPPSRPGRRRWPPSARRRASARPSRAASAYSGCPARQGVAAHHPDDAGGPRRSSSRASSTAWSCSACASVAATSRRAAAAGPGVDPGVQGRVVAAVEPVVQLVGGVERAAVGVERDVGHVGEDQRAAGPQRLLVGGSERRSRAAARPPGRAAAAARTAAGQVEVLQPPAAPSTCARRDQRVELLEGLDLDRSRPGRRLARSCPPALPAGRRVAGSVGLRDHLAEQVVLVDVEPAAPEPGAHVVAVAHQEVHARPGWRRGRPPAAGR